MGTCRISFMLAQGDEPKSIRDVADWDAVPRVGERVKFTGPEFGENEHDSWEESEHATPPLAKTGRIVGQSLFEVFAVDWDEDGSVEVFLSTPPGEQVFKLWCGCSVEERKEHGVDEDGRCENCGNVRRVKLRG